LGRFGALWWLKESHRTRCCGPAGTQASVAPHQQSRCAVVSAAGICKLLVARAESDPELATETGILVYGRRASPSTVANATEAVRSRLFQLGAAHCSRRSEVYCGLSQRGEKKADREMSTFATLPRPGVWWRLPETATHESDLSGFARQQILRDRRCTRRGLSAPTIEIIRRSDAAFATTRSGSPATASKLAGRPQSAVLESALRPAHGPARIVPRSEASSPE